MFSVILAVSAIAIMPASASSGGGCSQWDVTLGTCVDNDGTTVTVGGTDTTPGTGGGPAGPGVPGGPGTPPPSPPGYTGSWCEVDDAWWSHNNTSCPPVDDDDDDTTPPITLNDLVQFMPNGSPLTVEPFGIGIVGLPSNFVAASAAHTASGTLFGRSVNVRFTPDLHRFHYGDGETKLTASRGRTWESAGQAQFTPTATSHVYGARGFYTVRVDVLYTAAVNFGAGWVPIPGHVTARGPTQQIQIYEARTALVAYTCDELPGAPGC